MYPTSDKTKLARELHTKKQQDSLESKRHREQLVKLSQVERSFISAIQQLVRFMDGKTTKTEVVNQLKEIGTPDALKVVKAVNELNTTLKGKNVDLSEVSSVLKEILTQVSDKPEIKIPEQKDTIKVSNLKDIDFTTLEKAIKGIVITPKVDVKVPETKINVEKPDLRPLQDTLLSLIKAVEDKEYPEIPKTDLNVLEQEAKDTNKKLDEANKNLKAISEKRFGGGGGGGSGTSYKDSTGKLVYVELVDGAVPITGTITAEASTLAEFQYNDSDDTTTASTEYFGYTKPDGTWLVKKLTATTLRYATITNNGAVTTYTDAWAAIASLTYGRMDEAF